MQTFSPEVERLVEQAMSLCESSSAEDILRDALRHWIERRETIAAIQLGLNDVAAGRTIAFDVAVLGMRNGNNER